MQVWEVVVDGNDWGEKVEAETMSEALVMAEEEVSAYLERMSVENEITKVAVVRARVK
jgi:hypothetical protein